MLARSSDPSKLHKVHVVTYLDNVCLPKLPFLCVRSTKVSEISLADPNSSKIRVRIKIEMKN